MIIRGFLGRNLEACQVMNGARQICVALLLIAFSGVSLGQSSTVTIRSGHGGHWYQPDRSGEGWALELLDSHTALLYWFTYNESGGQRWMTAVGRVLEDDRGQYLDFEQLVVTRGGRFGPAFDPDQVEREAVGTATLRFHSCDEGVFSYSAFGQSQSIAIERLAHTMGTACESRNGYPGRVASEQAGQSGSWFDVSRSGEGYTLQWMNPTSALLVWYTYDTEGNQYWMLGVGQLVNGRLHFPELHSTRGGRFGNALDPSQIERFEWER